MVEVSWETWTGVERHGHKYVILWFFVKIYFYWLLPESKNKNVFKKNKNKVNYLINSEKPNAFF